MDKNKLAFTRKNFILLGIGMAVVVLGFILMAGPGSTETHFDPAIFSARRIKLAPALCFAGFVFMMHTGAGNATNATAAEMNAIASSIIGGTLLTGGVGNVIGTLFGVLTLSTIKSIVTTSGLRDPWWQSITTGAMLCFFIVLQSVVLMRRAKNKEKK